MAESANLPPIRQSKLEPLPPLNNKLVSSPLPPIQMPTQDALISYPKLPEPITTNNQYDESVYEPIDKKSDENDLKPVLPGSHLTGLPENKKPTTITDAVNSSQGIRTKQTLVGVNKPPTFMIWSIISAAVLFPTLFWIPALICSVKSRINFKLNKYHVGKRMARLALVFNIVCIVVAVAEILGLGLGLGLTKKVANSTVSYNCGAFSCWAYCRSENSPIIINGSTYNYYWSCYDSYYNYSLYIYDERYVDCIRRPINSTYTYLCKNAYF